MQQLFFLRRSPKNSIKIIVLPRCGKGQRKKIATMQSDSELIDMARPVLIITVFTDLNRKAGHGRPDPQTAHAQDHCRDHGP